MIRYSTLAPNNGRHHTFGNANTRIASDSIVCLRWPLFRCHARNSGTGDISANSWTVRVTDSNGLSSDATMNITVDALPAPSFVVAGYVASGTGTLTLALPSGIVTNDILLLFVETANQAGLDFQLQRRDLDARGQFAAGYRLDRNRNSAEGLLVTV